MEDARMACKFWATFDIQTDVTLTKFREKLQN